MVPPLTYAAALERLSAVERDEADPAVNPICRSFARTHGGRADRCVVLLHGFTNCPQQYRVFAERLYARGHNVYVPRAPGHGMADRLTTALAALTGARLIAWLEQALAIAHGLGDRVDLMGLSSGGNLAAHAAQWRPDIHQAVILAPVLGTPTIAGWAVAPIAGLAAVGPNMFRWWDDQHRDDLSGPRHAYPRYSTRALGEIVRLGLAVLSEAAERAPAARDILVVTNANDEAVSNGPVDQLVAHWRARGAPVRSHCFPKALGLVHDCIDPDQPRQQIELVYPALLELMG
ncbi:MAG: alpha/beta fold hydrolase [Chloroflexales bacterium]|nr:alpha/beta fold hydrolase [Chloroflexales bacterium]